MLSLKMNSYSSWSNHSTASMTVEESSFNANVNPIMRDNPLYDASLVPRANNLLLNVFITPRRSNNNLKMTAMPRNNKNQINAPHPLWIKFGRPWWSSVPLLTSCKGLKWPFQAKSRSNFVDIEKLIRTLENSSGTTLLNSNPRFRLWEHSTITPRESPSCRLLLQPQ